MAIGLVRRAPSDARASRWDVDDLLREMDHRGFDLERPLYVGYVVETGHRRELAFTLWRFAAAGGWQPALYADGSGFVVRFGRHEQVTRDQLVAEQRYLDSLVETFAATIRAVSIEDLARDNRWARLAARQSGRPVPAAAANLPAASSPRRSRTRPSAQPAIA